MDDSDRDIKNANIAKMLAAAVSSAERVVRDLNSAHSKAQSTNSPSDRSGSRVHSQANSLDGDTEKCS